jgi:hypothetical protein
METGSNWIAWICSATLLSSSHPAETLLHTMGWAPAPIAEDILHTLQISLASSETIDLLGRLFDVTLWSEFFRPLRIREISRLENADFARCFLTISLPLRWQMVFFLHLFLMWQMCNQMCILSVPNVMRCRAPVSLHATNESKKGVIRGCCHLFPIHNHEDWSQRDAF